MSRNGTYSSYGSYRGGRRRKRSRKGGNLIALLLIFLVAAGMGTTAFHISRNTLGDRPNADDMAQMLTPAVSPTQMAQAEPTKEPTPTPEPEPTVDPNATPTPTPIPRWDDDYLIDFVDNREKIDVKGAYVGLNLNTDASLKYWLNLADTTELNAVVIDVKADSGRITYQMENAALQATGACSSTYSDMKGLLATLKEHGIYTIARVVCFSDPYIGTVYPEYQLKTVDGAVYKDAKNNAWTNPYNEDVWKYIVDICEQAVLDGFDEICFDYIRVSTYYVGTIDFGEKAETMTRSEAITAFTKYACNRLKPLGAKVSASVYGAIIRSTIDSTNVGQDYVEMSRYLDYICPMVYPSHYARGYAGLDNPDKSPYELLKLEMDASVKKLAVLAEEQDTYADVRPWLQAFTYRTSNPYTASMIRKQVQATYDAGYTSFMYWNAGANYVDGCFLSE